MQFEFGRSCEALTVPAMMIDVDSSASNVEGDNQTTTRVIFESAKAVVKSVIVAIEPFFGLHQAMFIPQEFRDQMINVDELIFSTSNLKHVWNVCGSHK